jgi:hypothetical protein
MTWNAWHHRAHHRAHHREIDRHFSGRLRPRAEARMRSRMEKCASCRAHYQRHLIAEAALPGGDERALDRLWRSIRAAAYSGGGSGAPRTAESASSSTPSRWRWRRSPRRLAFGGAVLATAVVLIIAVPRRVPPIKDEPGATGLVARGGGAALAAPPVLHVYRSVSQHAAEALTAGAIVRSNDGLLFAYSNPMPTLTRLMVFAIDEMNTVHWYYPSYVRADEDPQAVPIVAGAIGVELGEEIRHALPLGALRVYGLFLSEPHRVLEIEALVSTLAHEPGGVVGAEAHFPLTGCAQTSVLVRVAP